MNHLQKLLNNDTKTNDFLGSAWLLVSKIIFSYSIFNGFEPLRAIGVELPLTKHCKSWEKKCTPTV